jgi:type I restriction enzyme S subunit
MAGEWSEQSVAELQAAGALLVEDGNHGENRPRPDEFSTEGIQFIRAADMDSGRVLFERAQRINEVARQRVRKGIGAGGDVLLSHKGTVGKVAYVPLDAPPFVCSPQTTFWRVKDPKQLDRRYIYFYLLSRTFREQLDSRKGETDMADYVSLTTQRTLKVTVPPLAEQKAIAAVLGSLDDKIELNRRMNATLEAMARALFQSWFVDFDPVRAKLDGRQPSGLDPATAALFPATFQNSESGLIPKGWTVGKVGDLATLNRNAVNPGDFPTETFDHFSLPAFDNGRTPKVELGSAIMSNKFTVTPNSVLLSKLNPHIPRIWLPDLHASRRSVCSTEFMVACSMPGVSREFLFSLFTSSAFASIYGTLVTGMTGSHQRIRPESVLDMKIVIPSAALVRAFTDIAKSIFDRINRNTEQSRTLATLRDTLLPKLLSGELRTT